MKDLAQYSLTMLIVLDQNQSYGGYHRGYIQIVSLTLTTMDALIVMMWVSAVSQVYTQKFSVVCEI